MTQPPIENFLADERGVAAIELALVAPIIAAMAVVSFGIWQAAGQGKDATSALDAGVQYYLNGGLDDAVAESTAEAAWDNMPANGNVTTARNYKCGTTAALIDTVCAGGRTSATYVTLSATGSDANAILQRNIAVQRVVRVR